MKKLFNPLVVAASLILWGAVAHAQDAVPKHLELARDLVANVKVENNQYTRLHKYLRLPADSKKGEYEVNTSCIGFVETMLDKGSGIRAYPSTKKFAKLYSILDYVDAVDRGEIWQKLPHVQDLKPGDVITWAYLIKGPNKRGNGHIVLVDAAPVKLDRALDHGKGQYHRWEVQTIDASSGPASADDTRFVEGTTVEQAENAVGDTTSPLKKTGVGRGKFYLFTDGKGAIQAVSYGFQKAKLNYQDKEWHVLLARPTVAR